MYMLARWMTRTKSRHSGGEENQNENCIMCCFFSFFTSCFICKNMLDRLSIYECKYEYWSILREVVSERFLICLIHHFFYSCCLLFVSCLTSLSCLTWICFAAAVFFTDRSRTEFLQRSQIDTKYRRAHTQYPNCI